MKEEKSINVCISLDDKDHVFSMARALALSGSFNITEGNDDSGICISGNGSGLVISSANREDIHLPVETDSFLIASYIYELAGIGTHDMSGDGAKVMTFRARHGGAGTTSIAVAAGRILFREYGKRSLFLSLCSFNLNRFVMTVKNDRSFAELIYRIREGRTLDITRFILRGEETDYVFVPAVNINAVNVTAEDVESIARLASVKGYERLIVDLGTSWSPELKKLVRCSHIVINVGFEDKVGINVGRNATETEKDGISCGFDVMIERCDKLDEIAMFAGFANDVTALVRRTEEKFG